MIKKYNNMSFLYGVPGLVIQVAGGFMEWGDMMIPGMGRLVALVGLVLFIVGLCYYAKAKGREATWGLMGLLSLIGLIVLACLKDRSGGEG